LKGVDRGGHAERRAERERVDVRGNVRVVHAGQVDREAAGELDGLGSRG